MYSRVMLCRIADGVSLLFKNRFSEKPLSQGSLSFCSTKFIISNPSINPSRPICILAILCRVTGSGIGK